MRWTSKPIYTLERTLDNQGDILWSEMRAKATDLGTAFLSAAFLMCIPWDFKVFCDRRALWSERFTKPHIVSWPALEET